jgi:hypothetical protein
MKRIKSIYVLLVLILPILFSSCDPEESFEPKFEDGIPPTGLYFKAKIGDVVWQGNDLAQMFSKTEPQGSENKMITLIRNRVYVHVNVNDDGSFSGYRVQYVKNKSYSNTGGYFNFDEWMEYENGSLNVIKNENGRITAKFTGKLSPVNNYAEDVDVIIYFQEFPINPVVKK